MACECMKPELDVFIDAPVQTSTEQGQWIEYHPLATLDQACIILMVLEMNIWTCTTLPAMWKPNLHNKMEHPCLKMHL